MKTRHANRLSEVRFELSATPIPRSVAALLADGQRQIDSLNDALRVAMPAFVPSDYEIAYRALSGIETNRLASGRRFLELGSGIGVVTCLASQLGFDAVGIEIEQPLVEVAIELARAHSIAAEFACGSFVPDGAEVKFDQIDDFTWMSTNGSPAYESLDLEPDDFDLIFAYPWPGEEQVIFDLFSEYAATGALLLTYHGMEGVRLQRKVVR